MTTEHSTYTYYTGAQETVTLTRGLGTPSGHALLKIEHSSGRIADCYVDLAWLRDRADHLADTLRPLTPCQCHEKHAPTYWKGVVREYKDALEKAEKERDEALDAVARHEDRESGLYIEESWDRAATPRPLTPDANARGVVDFLAAALANLADVDRDYLARILTKGAR